MKTTTLKIGFIFLFLGLIGAGCEKDNKSEPEIIETFPLDTNLGVDSLYGVPASIFMEDKQSLLSG